MTPLSSALGAKLPGSGTVIGRPPAPSIHCHGSLGPDDGAMALLRKHYPCLSNHSNMRDLGDNLVKAFESQPGRNGFPATSTILGHGNSGYVEVGCGQNDRDLEAYISPANEHVWGPQFARLRAPPMFERHPYWGDIPRFRSINFMSCTTAFGLRGHVLLQRIADIGNLRVTAYSALLLVNEHQMFYERGGQLRCCLPQDAPRNTRGYTECRKDAWPGELDDVKSAFPGMAAKGFAPGMEAEDIDSISVVTPDTPDPVVLPKEVAPGLFAQLFASPPYAKDCAVMAAVSARFTLNFRSQSPVTVDLFADRLALSSLGAIFLVSGTVRRYLTHLGIR
jgi:hypothetical protein